MKKKFMRFLALASCVTLLTGCDSNALGGLGGKWNSFVEWGKGLLGLKQEEQKEEEKPQKEDEEEAPEQGPKKPDVKLDIFDLPEELLPGSVLDLDDYVTVSGTSESFKIELDASASQLASVEGHQISVVGEGVISFKVSVGEKSETLSFRSISNERKEFRSFMGELEGDKYIMQHVYVDSTTYQISIGGGMTHGQGYSFDEDFEQISETEYLPGGYVEGSDGKVYSYVLEEDQNQELVPHLKVYGNEPEDIADVTGGFAFDWEELEILGEDESYLQNDFVYVSHAKEDDVKSMLQISVDFADYGCKYVNTQIERFDLTAKDENDEEYDVQAYMIIPQILYNGEVRFWDLYVLYQEDDTTVDVMEEYVASSAVPQGLSFDMFASVLTMMSSGEFTLSTDYGLYLGNTKLTPEQGAALFTAGTVGAAFAEASGTVNAYVTSTQIHVEEVGLEEYSTGLILGEDGNVYSYSFVEGEGEEPGKFVAEATPYQSFAEFDPEENFTFLNKNTVLVDPQTAEEFHIYDSIFVNDVMTVPYDENYPGFYICDASFAGATSMDLLSYLLYYSTPVLGEDERYGLGDIFYMMAYYDFLSDLEVHVTFLIDTSTSNVYYAEISASMILTSTSSGYVCWEFHTTFTDDQIPDTVVVTGLPA